MLEVTRAEYRDGYRIGIEFNNGEAGVVDLADALWGPMFEPMKDVERFKRFVVSDMLHTLSRENDADLAPEYLYEKLAGHSSQPAACKNAG
jgi:Protein of unknown function (DUF2442)